MRKVLVMSLVLTMVGLGAASTAWAGAKLQINDDAMIDLGFRVQSLLMVNDSNIDPASEGWEKKRDFKVRRARFRLKGVVNEYVEGFLQTDVSAEAGGTGADNRVIDAYVLLKPDPWARFYVGLNMVPILRQNLTSSGALMAMDRPGVAYKSLTWGARSRTQFTNGSYSQGDSGLRGPDGVRDNGVTLFGSGKLGDDVHGKYYLGVYDGVQASGVTEDNDHFAGRVQLNFFDSEPGYYNSSTYLGKKKTLGIGAGFDVQTGVGAGDVVTAPGDTSGVFVDYSMFTVDGFLEYPVGDGSLTVEGGFIVLDFGDVTTLTHDFNADQGSGYYVQAGYLVNEKWQPWAEFEGWTSDSATDRGTYTAFRVGLSYYIQGQNANVKAGFESFKSDNEFIAGEDAITSFILGTFITY